MNTGRVITAALLLAALALIVFASMQSPPVEEGVVATSSAVTIPNVLALAIQGLVLAGFVVGTQFVFDAVGLDLRGYAAGVAVVVGEFILLQLQNVINVIPAQYDLVVTIALSVIVQVITGLGVIRLLTNPDRARALFAASEK